MKTKRVKPTDYEKHLRLSEINHWNRLTLSIATAEVNTYGFYSCVLSGVKTLITK